MSNDIKNVVICLLPMWVKIRVRHGYPLLWGACSSLLLIYKLYYMSLAFWFVQISIHSTYKSFVRYMHCEYLLPICGFLFHYLNDVFWWKKFLILMMSNLSFFLCLVFSYPIWEIFFHPNLLAFKKSNYNLFFRGGLVVFFFNLPTSPSSDLFLLWWIEASYEINMKLTRL